MSGNCKACKNLGCAMRGTDWTPNPAIKCFGYMPQTNADRIRAMTDEELAETFAGGCPNGDRLNCGKHYLHGGRDCFSCWLDWLKAPADKER